ncbi:O-antigen ligase domain-containing protein [Brevibacillus fluminis]|uniref:O-antigen ligase domain-containing protein n=1 Tax=Brevibacillus fluminis TaxID=511487 RepID=A0A3M8DGZ1_9BACL|nr:O-antigen ligase family protein [Brevibacillus fluminis]RNB87370.1 O-antigen ligase domain-containing protein [Brevibacillus fluminis]
MSKLTNWMDGKAIAFALFLFAGNLKADPRLAWLPIDFTLLFAFLTAVFVIREWIRDEGRFPRELFWVLLLFFSFAIPIFWTEFTPYAVEKVSRLFTLTLLVAVAPMFLFRTDGELRRLFNVLTILGLLMGIDSIITLFTNGRLEINPNLSTGITAFGSNTIALGRSAGLAFIWIAVLALEKRLKLLPSLGLLGILVVVLLGSGSRGPLLTAVASLILLGLLFYWKKQAYGWRFTGVLVILILVGAYSVTIAPETASQRIEAFLQGNFTHSEQMRMLAYARSWDMIVQTPLGIGWGGFVEHINLWFGATKQYPHNIFLETLLEGGWLVGLCLIIIPLLALFRIYRRATSMEARVLFALLFFFLTNAMVSGDINDNKEFFAFMALSLVYRERTL